MDTGYPERLGLDRPLILKQFETELNPGNQGKSYYIPMFFKPYPTFRTPTAPTKKNSSFAASPSCDRGIHLDAAADGTGVREPEGACVEATEKQKGIYSTKKSGGTISWICWFWSNQSNMWFYLDLGDFMVICWDLL